ncbi:MAG: cytosolic protein [Gammaproteobacteria bacterium]|nr:cytosolic protein [Gammaproteobacteria bacterium]
MLVAKPLAPIGRLPLAATTNNPALNHFSIAKYRFTLTAESDIVLPVYKGATFHGGFGRALKKISPAFYDYFYTATAKPFALTPPLDERPEYPPGSTLQFDLVLFGTAIAHFPICFAAFEFLGQQLGFGYNRGRYRIHKVQTLTPGGAAQCIYEDRTWRPAQPLVPGQDIASTHHGKHTQPITLALQTRLRLKDNNRLVRETPPFTLLLNRLLGRLQTLSTFYQQQPLLSQPVRQALLERAANINIQHTLGRLVPAPAF